MTPNHNEELDNLVRDLTKVGSLPKSEARRRILEYGEMCRKEGYREGVKKSLSDLAEAMKSL